MGKCSFCSRQIEPGRGLIYVAPAIVYNFCSSKCRKNHNLHRDKRKVAWIRKSSAGKAILKEGLLRADRRQGAKEEKGKKPEAKPEEQKEEKPAEKK